MGTPCNLQRGNVTRSTFKKVPRNADHSLMSSHRVRTLQASWRSRVLFALGLGLAAALSSAQGSSVFASTQSQELFDSFRDGATVLSERGFEFYEDALFGYGNDFVIVTVLAVRDSGATFVSPPRVTVRVHRVLRGNLRRGVHELEWLPEPLYMPCSMGEGENIARWQKTPLAGPAVGKRLILSGVVERSGLWGANAWSRFEDDLDTRRVVEERIHAWKPRHEAWLKQVRDLALSRR